MSTDAARKPCCGRRSVLLVVAIAVAVGAAVGVYLSRRGSNPAEQAADAPEVSAPILTEKPCSPEAVLAVAKAHGLEVLLPIFDPPRTASPPGPPPGAPWDEKVTIVLPRGKVSRSGFRLVVDRATECPELSAYLWPDGPKTPALQITIPAGEGWFEADLPRAFADAHATGAAPTLKISSAEDPLSARSVSTEFTFSDAAGYGERMATLGPEGKPHPAAGMVAILLLLEDGLAAEAFDAARRIAEKNPDRNLPLRLALEGLARLGLQDAFLYYRYRLLWVEAH